MVLKQSRNIRNSVWNLANTLIYPIGFLALTPFFMDSLGEHLFGSWMLLNSIVFISVHVLHFGMGPSIAMYVAEARGKNDPQRLKRYYNSALNFTHLLAIFAIILTMNVWYFTPDDLYKWEGIQRASQLKVSFVLTCVLIGVKFYEQLFMGFYKGFEEYDTAAKFNMAHKITMLIGQAIVLFAGYGLAAIIAISLVTNTILVFAQFIWSKRYLIDYQWSTTFDPLIFSRLRHFGFWNWLQTIVSLLSFQLDRLVVAIALGTDIVGYYSIASMIANHLHIMLEAMVGWIFPAVSRIVKEKGDPKPLYYSVRSALVILSLVGLSVLYMIREPLFKLWLGQEKFSAVIEYIELFIFFEIFYVLTIAPKFFLNGISELKLITSLEVGYKAVGILTMLAFFYFDRSASALIWGQIAAMMVMMPLEMGIVNSRVLRSNLIFESVVLLIPCFALFGALYVNDLGAQLLLGLITIVSTYLGYVRYSRLDFKLLLE